MNGRQRIQQFIVGIFIAGVLGCGPAHPVYMHPRGQIDKHYIKSATRIEYPDTHVQRTPEVMQSTTPFTIDNADMPREYFDLTLEEAISTTMQNSRILRSLTGFSFGATGANGAPQALLSAPASVATVYDIALAESNPLSSVEAALSAFDAQLGAALGWSYSDPGAHPKQLATTQDNGSFQAGLSKMTATGGRFWAENSNGYFSGSNYTDPFWNTSVGFGFQQPLLQGSGVQFNRIAGPQLLPVVGVYGGVAIARINTDMSIVDFEVATRNLVFDVEQAYWNLYYAYHYLESIKAGYISAQKTWSMVNRKLEAGAIGGDAQSEAQSRNQYFLFRSQVEDAQNKLFKAESALRYIMGITPTDGRLFRPSTEPTLAPLALDWNEVVVEALARAPELRKQKWDVKKKELELTASRNFLLPRLDLIGSYQFNGVGDDLINSSHHSNAYGSMTGGNYQGWSMGLEFSKAIGNRKELAGVRNASLALARSQAILQQQELELTYQLTDSFREIATLYRLCETGLQRRIASEMEVHSVQTAYDVGTMTIDKVLDAQRRLAEAEASFYNNVISYNLAISELHKRKGSLLEYNNVYLLEGPWPNQAYYNARELARKRDAGQYMDYGYTNPQVFSRGTYRQFQGIESGEWSGGLHDNTTPGGAEGSGQEVYTGDDLHPALQQNVPQPNEPQVIETDNLAQPPQPADQPSVPQQPQPAPQQPTSQNSNEFESDAGMENQPRPLRRNQIAAR